MENLDANVTSPTLQTSDSGGAAVLKLPNGGMMPAPSDISYERKC